MKHFKCAKVVVFIPFVPKSCLRFCNLPAGRVGQSNEKAFVMDSQWSCLGLVYPSAIPQFNLLIRSVIHWENNSQKLSMVVPQIRLSFGNLPADHLSTVWFNEKASVIDSQWSSLAFICHSTISQPGWWVYPMRKSFSKALNGRLLISLILLQSPRWTCSDVLPSNEKIPIAGFNGRL